MTSLFGILLFFQFLPIVLFALGREKIGVMKIYSTGLYCTWIYYFFFVGKVEMGSTLILNQEDLIKMILLTPFYIITLWRSSKLEMSFYIWSSIAFIITIYHFASKGAVEVSFSYFMMVTMSILYLKGQRVRWSHSSMTTILFPFILFIAFHLLYGTYRVPILALYFVFLGITQFVRGTLSRFGNDGSGVGADINLRSPVLMLIVPPLIMKYQYLTQSYGLTALELTALVTTTSITAIFMGMIKNKRPFHDRKLITVEYFELLVGLLLVLSPLLGLSHSIGWQTHLVMLCVVASLNLGIEIPGQDLSVTKKIIIIFVIPLVFLFPASPYRMIWDLFQMLATSLPLTLMVVSAQLCFGVLILLKLMKSILNVEENLSLNRRDEYFFYITLIVALSLPLLGVLRHEC